MHFSCLTWDGERAATDGGHGKLLKIRRNISHTVCLKLFVQQSCLLYVLWVQKLANTSLSVSAHPLVHV